MTRSVHGYTIVTISLLAANFLMFLLQVAVPGFTELIALTPTLAISGYYWQFFTYMFAHGGITHLGLNMLALFMFGGVMERMLGWKKFVFLYLVAGLGSSFLHIALTGISNIPMLGASGAVFAVLAAYAFKFPKNIIFVFPGIPVPAALLVAFFIIFELFSGFVGFGDNIAHFGHLGGILVGLLTMLYWRQTEKRGAESPQFEWIWESW
jgi:membrane associated rhomboid family serine protease